MKIISWESSHYPNIEEQDKDIQVTYKKLKSHWDELKYINIAKDNLNHNNPYLFTFLYDTLSSLTIHEIKYIEAKNRMVFVIENYLEESPRAVKYAFSWLVDMAIQFRDAALREQLLIYLIKLNKHIKDITFLIWNYILYIKSLKNVTLDIELLPYLFKIKTYLTKFGKLHIDDVYAELATLIQESEKFKGIDWLDYYYDIEIRPSHLYVGVPNLKTYPSFEQITLRRKHLSEFKELVNEAENNVREYMDVPQIGEGWISESILFKQLKDIFYDEVIFRHHSPDFVGQQHYDIYFTEYKIAIEYQGLQHFEPIDFFGGEEQFIKNVERDKRKKRISKENDVILIEVLPDYDLYDLATYIYNKILPKLKMKYNIEDSVDGIKTDNIRKSYQEKVKNYHLIIEDFVENPKMSKAMEEEYKLLLKHRDNSFKDSLELTSFEIKNYKLFSYNNDQIYVKYLQTKKIIESKSNHIINHRDDITDFLNNYWERRSENNDVMYETNLKVMNIILNYVKPIHKIYHNFLNYYSEKGNIEFVKELLKEVNFYFMKEMSSPKLMLTYNFDHFIGKAATQSNGQTNTDTLINEYEKLIARKPTDSAELLALESQRVKFENKHYKILAINPQILIQRWNVLKDKIPGLWNKDFIRETEEYRKNFFNNMSSYSRETSSEMSNTLVKMYQERAKYHQNAQTLSQITVTLMNLLKRLKEYELAIEIGNHVSRIHLPVHTGKEFNERVKDLEYHQERE